MAVLIERAVNLAKGSGEPNKNRAGRVTEEQVEEVAKIKMRNLNCFSLKIGGHACFALKKKEFPRPARSVPDFLRLGGSIGEGHWPQPGRGGPGQATEGDGRPHGAA